MNEESKNGIELRKAPQEDWFLQHLVNIANKDQFGFGITLNVGGMLVSGLLTSGKQYFEGFGTDFATIFEDNKDAEEVRKTFNKHGEIYDTEASKTNPPSYIHLKNAKFFNTQGKPIPSNRGVWWRGRITEIHGFSLGSLNAEEA